MHYSKWYLKLPPSKREALDLNPRALRMAFSKKGHYWYPAGLRSRQRYQRILRPNEDLATRMNSDPVWFFFQSQPKTIPESFWQEFLRLAKWRKFDILVNGKPQFTRQQKIFKRWLKYED